MVDKVDGAGAGGPAPEAELTPAEEQELSDAMTAVIVNQYAMQISSMQSEMKRQMQKMSENKD